MSGEKTIVILNDAIFEAQRFIKAAEVAIEKISEEEYFYGGKESAAARRASMDLTRSLVKIRATYRN